MDDSHTTLLRDSANGSHSTSSKWERSWMKRLLPLGIGVILLLQMYMMMDMKYGTNTKTSEPKQSLVQLNDPTHRDSYRHPQLLDCSTIDPDTDNHYVVTKTNPPFIMNIHDPDVDMGVSHPIAKYGQFEGPLITKIMDALDTAGPNPLFIDLGGNIGMYTLTALANNYDVVSFEPFRENYSRLCKSVRKNPGFSEKRLSLYRAAVVETGPQIVNFAPVLKQNFGGTSITSSDNKVVSGTEGVDFAAGLTLDSLLQSSLLPVDRPVVMKIDIEGGECKALSGGLEFLRKVDLRYLQMEVLGRNSFSALSECDKLEEVFEVLGSKGLKPFLHPAGKGGREEGPFDPHSNWRTWFQPTYVIGDLIWK